MRGTIVAVAAAAARRRPVPAAGERRARGDLGAQAGLGAHLQLVELGLGRPLSHEHRAEEAPDEPERDADDPGVRERVPRQRAALGVGAGPHRRADHDERDRADHAEQHAHDRSGRVEAPPGERQEQRREVGAGRHGERQADHERHVQGLAAEQRDPDRDRADRERRDLRDPDLLALGVTGPGGRCSTTRRAPPRPTPRSRGRRRPRGSSRTRRRRRSPRAGRRRAPARASAPRGCRSRRPPSRRPGRGSRCCRSPSAVVIR